MKAGAQGVRVFMFFIWVYDFPLGLCLCCSFGCMLFLCLFGCVYMVLQRRRGVLRTNGQGEVVAGKSVFHYHHHSAWQRTEQQQVYRNTEMMDVNWVAVGV